MMTEADRRRTAYHEGGHAIVGMLTEGADPVRKISIIPRGQSLGVTFSAPDADRYNYSEQELRAKIEVALGGRAAEELVFGDLTTGAESDIQQLTQIARQMVGRWGMSPAIGTIAVLPSEGQRAAAAGHRRGVGGDAAADRRGGAPARGRVAREGHRAARGEPLAARLARAGAARARDARSAGCLRSRRADPSGSRTRLTRCIGGRRDTLSRWSRCSTRSAARSRRCACRSPTAATSAASTACRKRSSGGTTRSSSGSSC